MLRVDRLRITVIIILIVIILSLFIPKGAIESLTGKAILDTTFSQVYVEDHYENYTCNASLDSAWNLVSLPCVRNDTSINNTLVSVNDSYISVHTYNNTDLDDQWKSYNPSLPYWVKQDLRYINTTQGFWIRMASADELVVYGNITIPNSFPITLGWSLLGYTSHEKHTIDYALTDIDACYTIIWMFNATDDSYYYYNNQIESGTLGVIEGYHGYWMKVSKNCSWTVY